MSKDCGRDDVRKDRKGIEGRGRDVGCLNEEHCD